MIKEGKYIYCIINKEGDRNFDFSGINNRELTLFRYKDIVAVVSSSPVINFDRLDKKELMRHIAVHQKVNEELMKAYDVVVPMTFGIIAPNTDEVKHILERAYIQFKAALNNIGGKVEFAVQVYCEQQELLALTMMNPKVQKLREEASLRKGILAMPIKLKLGKLIHENIATYKQAYMREIQVFLNSLANDSTSNKLIEDDMIANFSFLIDENTESELDRKMQELGKKYEGKLRFKYVGPMPAYSFVNINLSLGNFELVDGARKLLTLGEEATFGEIRMAYYELAHQYHPDKYTGNPEHVPDQMKKIAHAYNILENYCRSYYECLSADREDRGDFNGRKYSFKEEEVKNSIIINKTL
ncbi:GvpL/GvpF family gas vesicle protein [Patescibacteria group bacterium]